MALSMKHLPAVLGLLLTLFSLGGCGQGSFNGNSQKVQIVPVKNSDANPEPLPLSHSAKAPIPVLSSSSPEIVGASPIPVTVEFDQEVDGFEAGDISLTNAKIEGFAGCCKTFTLNLIPLTDGDVGASIPAGIATAKDGGLANLAGDPLTRKYDSTSPVPNLTSVVSGITGLSKIPVRIKFSKTVTGFTAEDISITNAKIDSFSGSESDFAINIIPISSGKITINIPASIAQDMLGHDNVAAKELTLDVDFSRPTPVLSSTSPNPTNHAPIPFKVVFDKVVIDFIDKDLVVKNGVVKDFAGSDSEYTFNVVPNEVSKEITVSVPENVATDKLGNLNTASLPLSVIFDTQGPTINISSDIPDPTNAKEIPCKITFSKEVIGFDQTDLEIINATLKDFKGAGKDFSVSLIPTVDGLVSVRIPGDKLTDIPGNKNLASNTLQRLFDGTKPRATLSSEHQNPTFEKPFLVNIKWSENINGFTKEDILVTNGTLSDFQGKNLDYQISVIPTAPGAVTVQIPENKAADAVGNGNLASNPWSREYLPKPIPPDCEPGKGFAEVKSLTQEYTQGAGAKIEYSLSLFDCEGVQIKITEANLLFDFDAIVSDFTLLKDMPFTIKSAEGSESYSGTLKNVLGTDMFGNSGLFWSHFESSKPISFASKPRSLIVTIDVSNKTLLAPRVDADPSSRKMVVPTFMTFGSAKPATATVITNRP